ncbi:hypothetical protein HanOQP8_Chr14g0534031 [Helianthus annuus]|nr:hypothetical protein HanOQP8_Chr14g0534031 [Helianthus annuus]
MNLVHFYYKNKSFIRSLLSLRVVRTLENRDHRHFPHSHSILTSHTHSQTLFRRTCKWPDTYRRRSLEDDVGTTQSSPEKPESHRSRPKHTGAYCSRAGC